MIPPAASSLRRRTRFAWACAVLLAAAALPLQAASDHEEGALGSGTYRGRIHTERLMHQQARRADGAAALSTPALAALRNDMGQIAIVDTSGGVLIQPNRFDLVGQSITFQRAAGGYSVAGGPSAYDQAAANQGQTLTLGDDEALSVPLPFAFPYFNNSYNRAFIHSDGNITFEEPDPSSTSRNLPRSIAGPPRLAPLFTDLDPTKSLSRVSLTGRLDRVFITWESVPLFSNFGIGNRQTFQLVLHIDGGIQFHYSSIKLTAAIVGIMPGRLLGETTSIDFSNPTPGPFPAAIAEIFAASQSLDIFTTGQRFYQNHDDVFDFLVIFNDFGLAPGPGAFAFEVNVRNEVLGIGNLLLTTGPLVDIGKEFGSRRRLQSFLNMGPLTSYPDDPTANIPILSENTTLSVMGQEAGHRFLTYVRFLDPATGLQSSNILGRDLAHWSFFFNSDASVVEGNRIEDRGAGVSPRFRTAESVARFSEFDQYLMGLIPPEEVRNSFLVENATGGFRPFSAPRSGIEFDGLRKEIPLELIIAAEGPRIPHASIAQKRFNFAFALLVREGTEPSAADLAKIDRVRAQWEDFFNQAVNNRGRAETDLNRLLHLSAWPAAGLIVGNEGSVSVEIAKALDADLDVMLTAEPALITVPSVVSIPAGATSVVFPVEPSVSGVARLQARANQPGYDLAEAFIQVRQAASGLLLEVVSGGDQVGQSGTPLLAPVVIQVLDETRLPYTGAAIAVSVSGDGIVDAPLGVSNERGRLSVQWTLDSRSLGNTLTARLVDAPQRSATTNAFGADVRPIFSSAAIVNAASFNLGPSAANIAVAPGGLVTIFGTGLAFTSVQAQGFPLPTGMAGTSVLINGMAAPLLFVSPGQINLQIPFELAPGEARIEIVSLVGRSDPVNLTIAPLQPGIFFDPVSGLGAILTQDNKPIFSTPAAAGSRIQIFATGLGAVSPAGATGIPAATEPLSLTVVTPTVLIAGREALVAFSGLAPAFAGLYQVNADVPTDLAPGRYTLQIIANGLAGNEVSLDIQ